MGRDLPAAADFRRDISNAKKGLQPLKVLATAKPNPGNFPPPMVSNQVRHARASHPCERGAGLTEAPSQETGAANQSHAETGRPVVSSNSNSKAKENSKEENLGSLRSCLVEGDPAQITCNRRLRRRSLLLSVILQFTVLTALVLVPLLSKTEPLPIGIVMPMPPYHRPAIATHPAERPRATVPTHGLSFCLTCPPVLPHPTTNINNSPQTNDDSSVIGDNFDSVPDCPGCIPLGNAHPQPAIPRPPTPRVVHVTHIDPAMLTHRIEPVYPTLALQIRHEGAVELHAIIATDGSVRSLQVLEGDALFYQSALDAVRQWRYKPTILNGLPVEVDTHITVIYKLNR